MIIKTLNRLCMVCTAASVAAFLACSSESPTAGGGSDLPNGAIAFLVGSAVFADSTPAESSEVLLTQLVVTPSGDSVVSQCTTVVDADGAFRFDSLWPGRYALLIRDRARGLAAINQQVTVGDSGTDLAHPLRMARTVDLAGFITIPAGYYYSRVLVSIPGAGLSARLDLNRMYLLSDVPAGNCDLIITYEDIANYVRVHVRASTGPDTLVQMRNVELAVMSVMAQPAREFHASSFSAAYAIAPITYQQGQEPPWYGSVDLGRVTYYLWEGDQAVEWRATDPAAPRPYDVIVSGALYRDGAGTVLLETDGGATMQLSGPQVQFAGVVPLEVTVALVVRSEGPRVYYEVIDIRVGNQGFR